ncbi:MAG: ParB N-terminal domain-containing protein, partial [Acidobacteriia bacterium]|nr:ParB N-terminal domain-containing protein [Terriglobia bacterium]
MNKVPEPQRRALGRGLSTLLPARSSEAAAAAPPPAGTAVRVPIDSIDANPLQPRSVFQAERLRELSESIMANGVIQPLIVRR